MKAVLTRTPEGVTVDTAAIPSHQIDAMCRTLAASVERFFQNPEVKADFERWQQERRQTLKAGQSGR